MDDPLEFLRTAELGTLLAIATGAAITTSQLFPDLTTKQAPKGIVSLQLAWTKERARKVISSWRTHRLDRAANRSLLVDGPFIIFYSVALGLTAVLAGRAAEVSNLLSGDRADTIGSALAIAALVAGLCDFIENGGLALQLHGRLGQPIPGTTSSISALKWLLAFAVGVASLVLLIASAIKAL